LFCVDPPYDIDIEVAISKWKFENKKDLIKFRMN
jgi:hypothetical protein